MKQNFYDFFTLSMKNSKQLAKSGFSNDINIFTLRDLF